MKKKTELFKQLFPLKGYPFLFKQNAQTHHSQMNEFISKDNKTIYLFSQCKGLNIGRFMQNVSSNVRELRKSISFFHIAFSQSDQVFFLYIVTIYNAT